MPSSQRYARFTCVLFSIIPPLHDDRPGFSAFVVGMPPPLPWCVYARDYPHSAQRALGRFPCRPRPRLRRSLKRIRELRNCACVAKLRPLHETPLHKKSCPAWTQRDARLLKRLLRREGP